MHLDNYPDKVSRSYSVWMSALKYHNLSVQDTCTIPRPALTHPSPSPLSLLPNLAQIPVIAPLAPHERQLRHKFLGTDRADHACHPLTERLDPESGMNLREKQPSDNFQSATDAIFRNNPKSTRATSSTSSSPRPGPTPRCSKHSNGIPLDHCWDHNKIASVVRLADSSRYSFEKHRLTPPDSKEGL